MSTHIRKYTIYLLTLAVSMVGVWLNDFHNELADKDIFPDVYDGDFYENIPYENYLSFDEPFESNLSVFDIRSYGADPQATATHNRAAINAAVDACFAGGGGIVLIDGGEYVTGSVRLKSNTTFKIAGGSALIASRSREDMSAGCILYAANCENITITGPGKVCGEGNWYSRKPLKEPLHEPLEYSNTIEMRYQYNYRIRRPHESKYGNISNIINCSEVTIENIVFENSAHWTLKIENSEKVHVNRFVINNNRHIANADGIDILYSRHVLIEDSFISTADDGIVIKNWTADKVVNDVHIRNCEVMACTNSFKIGTETRGLIQNILIEDCNFFMRDIYPGSFSGIAVESMDGSLVTDVTIRNIIMDRITCPVFIRLGNRNRYADDTSDFSGSIDGIYIENVRATNAEIPTMITGVKNRKKGTNYVKNVVLKDFDILYTTLSKEALTFQFLVPQYEKEYPDSWRFMNLPAYGIWARHTDSLRIENYSVQPPAETKRRDFVFRDVKNLVFDQ